MVAESLPVGALILAAGIARRMGRSKLDLAWPVGGSILGRVLDVVIGGGVKYPVLVSGGHREQVESITFERRIPAVFNPDYETSGMLTSIAIGLAALEATPAGSALIMPADHPLVKPETISALIAAWRDQPERIWIPSHERRRGHPVLVPRDLWLALANEDGHQGLRSFLDRHANRIEHLNVSDAGIRMDIDDQETYQRLMDSFDS